MLFYTLCQVLSYILGTYANYSTVFKVFIGKGNDLTNEDLLNTVTVMSVLDCARQCDRSSRCGGYRFHDTGGTCHLSANGKPSEEGMTDSNVTPYFKIICGSAADVPNAQKDTEGHFTGAVTTYTCNPDYTPCLNKTTSVCQSTGQWEGVAGLCGQFRWHNTKTYFDHVLPCRPTNRLKVTVLATPSLKTRFSIYVMKGYDAILDADFRLTYGSRVNSIVLNSFIGGNWKTETNTPYTFILQRELYIVISLNNGHAMIHVDGSFITNYTCPATNPMTEYVKVEGNATVRMLEIST